VRFLRRITGGLGLGENCRGTSVVLGLLVLEEHVHGVQLLGRVVAATVGLSVLLHGVSAVPLAERYGRWHDETTATGRELHEATPVPEPAERRRITAR
jgi:sodium/hydrogen antiporter